MGNPRIKINILNIDNRDLEKRTYRIRVLFGLSMLFIAVVIWGIGQIPTKETPIPQTIPTDITYRLYVDDSIKGCTANNGIYIGYKRVYQNSGIYNTAIGYKAGTINDTLK